MANWISAGTAVFEFVRKFALLMTLFVVGLGTYLSAANATRWEQPLRVALYPLNADGSDAVRRYLASLDASEFGAIETFMQRESARYGVMLEQPVQVVLGPTISSEPPQAPWAGSVPEIAAWSLRLRWWAFRVTRGQDGPQPDIRLFLRYHDPQRQTELEHSLGLQKGRIGVVNVYASRQQKGTNNFVITHEMLHTLGATDKYGGPDGLPRHPDGYADPDRNPRYPQNEAEIMGGRIPLTPYAAAMPGGLDQARVGTATAKELRWIR